jgi:hypothetical protein
MLQKKFYFILIAAAFAVGCSSAPPTLQSGPDVELSFDGLTPVENTTMRKVWARPGAELDGFTKVMLEGAGIEFREVSGPESGSVSGYRRGSQTEFPLSEEDQQRLADTVKEAFTNALSESEKFELVDEPGPDVLLVRGALLDVVSNVPPDTVGRSRIFLSSVGEATLVLEVRNSQSKQIYVRTIDRRAAERAGMAVEANSVSTWAEVRRLAARWAGQLQRGLENLLEMENIPDA